VNGAPVEPKSSVAVHYRFLDERKRPRIKDFVDRAPTAHPQELTMPPGKTV